MINILFYTGIFTAGVILWGLYENSGEMYKYVSNKVDMLNKLNKFRKQSNISVYSIVKLSVVSVYTIIKTKFVMTIQTYMDGLNIIQKERNIFEINLFIKGKFVKILIRLKQGPSDVLFAMDGDLVDVTEKLVPYYSYELLKITPEILGTKELDLVMCNGENRKFMESEKIL